LGGGLDVKAPSGSGSGSRSGSPYRGGNPEPLGALTGSEPLGNRSEPGTAGGEEAESPRLTWVITLPACSAGSAGASEPRQYSGGVREASDHSRGPTGHGNNPPDVGERGRDGRLTPGPNGRPGLEGGEAWTPPAEGERARILDAIAEMVADAIWAELMGDSERLRSSPHGE
jgi:hypothetical protein